MNSKKKIHDGVVGIVVTLGFLLGYIASPAWLCLPAIVGLLLIQSAYTGFCPAYYSLDKREQAGKLPSIQ